MVRRIFGEFAAGKSPRAIARGLNAEAVPGPHGRLWRDTTIRGHATRRTGILRNDLYVGRLVWNKQGVYSATPTPASAWRAARRERARGWADVPELRIVEQSVWGAVQARLEGMRDMPGSKKQRQTEFWKQRRPKHLLTGLIHCSECGGLMSAVGKDYLACTAARSGAGCQNRKSIRRDRVEEVVLEGLKARLMAPELVEEFVREFHAEINRQRANEELQAADLQAELGRVSKKLAGLYDAIADGLRTPGLKDQLLALEDRQRELRERAQNLPAPEPRLHPKLAEAYRVTVTELHDALNDPEARTEAAEILRSLVDRISVRADADGHPLN